MTSMIGNSEGTGVATGFSSNAFAQAAGSAVVTGYGVGGSIGVSAGVGLAGAIAFTPIPSWPIGVPYAPMVDTWSIPTPFLDPIATDMDGGNQRLRSRPGSGIKVIKFAIVMTNAQYITFKTWCETVLIYGSSRFTMLVWLGNGFSTQTVQFEQGKPPIPTAMPPNLLSVEMQLRVFP